MKDFAPYGRWIALIVIVVALLVIAADYYFRVAYTPSIPEVYRFPFDDLICIAVYTAQDLEVICH